MEILRWDKLGNDVNQSPWKWSDSDLQVCLATHGNPGVDTGYLKCYWMRRPGGKWVNTGENDLQKLFVKVRKELMCPETQ